VLFYPILSTILLSFGIDFSGGTFTLNYYLRLFTDNEFWSTIINTIKFVSFSVSFQLVLGLIVALLLNKPVKGIVFFRVIALLPWTIPRVVVGSNWRWMYNSTFGIINYTLLKLGLVSENILWLSTKSTVLYSIIIANIWRGFPFPMLFMLAGLQMIPKSLYEAASIDGANDWSKFFYITLPNLKKTIIVVLMLSTIWEFRQIDLIMTMTGGGPGTLTDVLATSIYKQYFHFFQFNYASAMAITMSAMMLIVSIPYIRVILSSDEGGQ
jgi:multiple sugar transport system permease protein